MRVRSVFLVCMAMTVGLLAATLSASAQDVVVVEEETAFADSVPVMKVTKEDSLMLAKQIGHKKMQWKPDPKRVLWLSLVIPGAGQIYNRKYWKLPIIYGGFLGCTYALLWNQQMYKDYSQAYIDIMDDDPNTASYNKMLPLGYDISGREEDFKNIFKHKKDFYRRNRDLSIFAFGAVYLLSVIDAYVDAHLSSFDISEDLSMRIGPAMIDQQHSISGNARAYGLGCQIRF